MRLLIKNGTIYDGKTAQSYQGDVLVEKGIVAAIGKDLKLTSMQHDDKIIDATGQIVVPGLIDIHVHLREPGQEYKENIFSGTRAAAAGGFTAVACMPNTDPAIDTRATAEMVKAIALRDGVTKVYTIGAITKGRQGQELTEFGDLQVGGVVALSDDGSGIMKADVMRRAMEYSKAFQMPIICHCEDSHLAANGVMHEGYWSVVLGLPGIPSLAEELMVARDIELAKLTGARIHIAHISTKGCVDLIRRAKAEGVQVTAEVTPHHFVLTDEAVNQYDTNTKVNPPLRTKADVEALIQGLKDGTIDAIATDHAPHSYEEKSQEYSYAPFGLVGLETSLGLAITYLVEPGYLSWAHLVEKMSTKPAQILNLPGGLISEGTDADITIINPQVLWKVDRTGFKSLGKNTPFEGWQLKGKATYTIVNGQVVMEDERLVD